MLPVVTFYTTAIDHFERATVLRTRPLCQNCLHGNGGSPDVPLRRGGNSVFSNHDIIAIEPIDKENDHLWFFCEICLELHPFARDVPSGEWNPFCIILPCIWWFTVWVYTAKILQKPKWILIDIAYLAAQNERTMKNFAFVGFFCIKQLTVVKN